MDYDSARHNYAITHKSKKKDGGIKITKVDGVHHGAFKFTEFAGVWFLSLLSLLSDSLRPCWRGPLQAGLKGSCQPIMLPRVVCHGTRYNTATSHCFPTRAVDCRMVTGGDVTWRRTLCVPLTLPITTWSTLVDIEDISHHSSWIKHPHLNTFALCCVCVSGRGRAGESTEGVWGN